MSTTTSLQTNTTAITSNSPSTLFYDNKNNDEIIAPTATSTPATVKSITVERSEVSKLSTPSSENSSAETTTSCRENQEQVSTEATTIPADTEKSKSLFELASTKNEVESEKLESTGFSVSLSSTKKQEDEKPPFSFASTFGSTVPETKKSIFGSPIKLFSETSGGLSNLTDVKVNAFLDGKKGEATTTPISSPGKNIATSEKELSTGVVTFSFKTKTTPESNQPTLSSQPFKFDPEDKGGTQNAAATNNVDVDEGMDDDGAIGSISQKSSTVFGRSFMSGIGSTAVSNTGKNVFGMGTSNLLKNTSSSNESSSIFSGGMNKSMASHPSSFATAAQQAVQSSSPNQSTISNSVFGAAPKFGGPPVFGGKPVFGSTVSKPAPAFGGGAPLSTGGFSAFSGAKDLFGGVSSGASSVFGGGISNRPATKDTLFGGNQPNKSFSTWR
ncbi:hypothetical protein DICVIV_00048 [Dictyocaulus viviparus]|uniref:Uncharacterized protein n=1 Tax=Dictyocaulus viviparus TaxID=29172 RepID=A0A0D8YA32_DICVI|nr:hypothetical protein DICVIV_00048 [Dictyocaulus viviparus]